MQFLADTMQGDDLFGDRPGVADFYLYVMLLWAARFAVDVPAKLVALRRRLDARPAVQAARQAEGLRFPEYA
jgi:glutathione S-transferase